MTATGTTTTGTTGTTETTGTTTAPTEKAPPVLSGLRVIELATDPAGELTGLQLVHFGADGTAVRQVFEHEEAVAHDLVRLLALHMGDEADAAGVMFVARIVKSLFSRQASRECGRFFSRRNAVCEVEPRLL